MYLYDKIIRDLKRKGIWKKKELTAFLGRKYSIKKEENKYVLNDIRKLGIPVKKTKMHRNTVFIIGSKEYKLSKKNVLRKVMEDVNHKKAGERQKHK